MKTEKKNKIWQTFLLVLLVVVGLIGLFYLPRIQLFDKDLRRVNILSDVQRRDKDGNIVAERVADSLDSETAVKEAGKLRTEGKGYYPKDGDIMFFKFNVSRGK